MPETGSVGWLLAVEPLAGEGAAWTLFRRAPGQPAELVASGLQRQLGDLDERLGNALPRRTATGEVWTGDLCDPIGECALAVSLGMALLPRQLRDELLDAGSAPHTVSVSTRGWLGFVPWDLLALTSDGSVRLLEAAQVVALVPPTATRTIPTPAHLDRQVLRIIDPGPATEDDEGPGPIYPGLLPDAWYDADPGSKVLDSDERLDADGLAAELRSAPWSRLLYFGHVWPGSSSAPAKVSLHLHDRTPKERFTAFRWLADPYAAPAPPRVALIGCGSNDSQYLEQSGLVLAAYNAGARLIIATRWILPTAPVPGREHSPATELALAVDRAHDTVHPLSALRTWQRQRLDAWRTSRQPGDAPVVWASLCTWIGSGDDHDG